MRKRLIGVIVMVLLNQGVLEAGFSESDIAAIMSANRRPLQLAQLPPG